MYNFRTPTLRPVYQAASVEIMGFHRLVGYIRSVESALGKSEKIIYDVERECKAKLRRVETMECTRKNGQRAALVS